MPRLDVARDLLVRLGRNRPNRPVTPGHNHQAVLVLLRPRRYTGEVGCKGRAEEATEHLRHAVAAASSEPTEISPRPRVLCRFPSHCFIRRPAFDVWAGAKHRAVVPVVCSWSVPRGDSAWCQTLSCAARRRWWRQRVKSVLNSSPTTCFSVLQSRVSPPLFELHTHRRACRIRQTLTCWLFYVIETK